MDFNYSTYPCIAKKYQPSANKMMKESGHVKHSTKTLKHKEPSMFHAQVGLVMGEFGYLVDFTIWLVHVSYEELSLHFLKEG